MVHKNSRRLIKLTWLQSYLLTVAHAFQSLLLHYKWLESWYTDFSFLGIPCPSEIDHYRWVKGHKHSEYIVNFLFLRVLYRFIDFCLGSFLLLHFLASDTPSLKCRIINTSLVAIKVRSISVFYPIVPQIKDSFGLYTPTL